MKWSMLLFAVAIILGILFTISILYKRTGKEKYDPIFEEETRVEKFDIMNEHGNTSNECGYISHKSEILYDYLH